MLKLLCEAFDFRLFVIFFLIRECFVLHFKVIFIHLLFYEWYIRCWFNWRIWLQAALNQIIFENIHKGILKILLCVNLNIPQGMFIFIRACTRLLAIFIAFTPLYIFLIFTFYYTLFQFVLQFLFWTFLLSLFSNKLHFPIN